jgi:hypothetical protein
MCAVLEDAFLSFHKKFEADQRFMQRAREAENWFFSDDSRRLFSFVSICDALGLAPQYLRKKLKHWTSFRPGHSVRHEVESFACVNRRGFAREQTITDQAPGENRPLV